MRFGVVVFPGTNCDYDTYYVLKEVLKEEVFFLWHKDRDLRGADCVILPGGFSYGDYLRAGALASFSPIMEEIVSFVEKGGLVLGICNGFQILQEAGLLPGVMLKNKNLKFICKDVFIRVERDDLPFTKKLKKGRVLRIPIAHAEGNFYLEEDELHRLEEREGVVFRYVNEDGELAPEANPNGALNGIAGVVNEKGNVLGMMPHPERVSEPLLGGDEGRLIFESVVEWLKER
ncbi:MAG: phosphoribosylformylglycinamidine synthase subunit PurQ [Acidobacteria bacterium]|nr:phosphoribosylformylglycinamidine synthase subunit PurQ [Acidobacteriota bacterium]